MRYTAVNIGYALQRLEWQRAVIRRPELPPDLAGWCYSDAVWLAIFTSAPDALAISVEATELEGVQDSLARAQGYVARATMEASKAMTEPRLWPAVNEWLRRGAEHLAASDAAPTEIAAVRVNLANALFNADDIAGAVAAARQSLAVLDREADEEPMTWLWAQATIGGGEHLLGDDEAGLAAARAVLRRVDAFGTDTTLSTAAAPLAVAAAGAGAFDAARELISVGAESVRLTGAPLGRKDMLIGLGCMAGQAQDWERAAVLLAAAMAQGSQNALLVFRSPITGRMYLRHRDRAKEALGRDRARELRQQGNALSYEEAFALGMTG